MRFEKATPDPHALVLFRDEMSPTGSRERVSKKVPVMAAAGWTRLMSDLKSSEVPMPPLAMAAVTHTSGSLRLTVMTLTGSPRMTFLS